MELPQQQTTNPTTTTESEILHQQPLRLTYGPVEGSTSDIYLLGLHLPQNENTSIKRYRVTFICDCSSSMGKTYSEILIPSIKRYYEAVPPFDCTVVLFGKDITVVPIKQAADFRPLESKVLEPATNISGGISKAVEDAIAYSENHKDDHYYQVFFFASDGGHNTSSQAELEKSIDESGKKIKEKKLDTLFLVVGIGGSSNTASAMVAKQKIQTISATGQLPIHFAKSHEDLNKVMQELIDEQTLVLSGKILQFSCQAKDPSHGLLKTFISTPAAALTEITNEAIYYCLFKGDIKITNFLIKLNNTENYPVQIEFKEFNETYPIVSTLRATLADIAVLGVTNQNTELIKSYIDIIDKITKSISDRVFVPTVKSAEKRIEMMRSIKSGVSELQHSINEIKDKLKYIYSASNSEQAQFLKSAADMKYGNRALRRGNQAEAKPIFENIKTIFKEYTFTETELASDRISILSTATETEHYQMIREWVLQGKTDLEVVEMLYGYGALGYLILVSRSSSSDVDPWTIHIDYVSADLADTASAVCALNANHGLKDLSKHDVSDVIVVLNPKNPALGRRFMASSLFHTYNSVLFTRNLDLAIVKDQKHSLLMNSLIRVVCQFFEDQNLRTIGHMRAFSDILYTTLFICYYKDWKSFEMTEFWLETEKKLLSDNPAMYFTSTERDNIQSVSQLICLLLVKPQEIIITDDKKWELLKIAILGEALAREGKTTLKTKNLLETPRKLVQQLLQITEDGCIKPLPVDDVEPLYEDSAHSDKYDQGAIEHIVKDLHKFRRIIDLKRMLTFIEQWQRFFYGTKKLEVKKFNEISDSDIEKLFIEFREIMLKYVEPSNVYQIHYTIEAALYLQGILNPNSKDRKDGLPPVNTPELAAIAITGFARDVRIGIYRDSLSEKVKILGIREAEKNKAEREKAASMVQDEFMKYHIGNAKSFTYAEISELNKTRPINDKLSLTYGSHMLTNHCGYPTCPFYLKNLANETDIRSGNNTGLWGHLNGFFYPKNFMISGFHSRCFSVLRSKPNISRDDFVKNMLSEFDYQIRSKKQDKEQTILDIVEIWDTWQRWGRKDL